MCRAEACGFQPVCVGIPATTFQGAGEITQSFCGLVLVGRPRRAAVGRKRVRGFRAVDNRARPAGETLCVVTTPPAARRWWRGGSGLRGLLLQVPEEVKAPSRKAGQSPVSLSCPLVGPAAPAPCSGGGGGRLECAAICGPGKLLNISGSSPGL